jgi:hypothetical protein
MTLEQPRRARDEIATTIDATHQHFVVVRF